MARPREWERGKQGERRREEPREEAAGHRELQLLTAGRLREAPGDGGKKDHLPGG